MEPSLFFDVFVAPLVNHPRWLCPPCRWWAKSWVAWSKAKSLAFQSLPQADHNSPFASCPPISLSHLPIFPSFRFWLLVALLRSVNRVLLVLCSRARRPEINAWNNTLIGRQLLINYFRPQRSLGVKGLQDTKRRITGTGACFLGDTPRVQGKEGYTVHVWVMAN